MQIAIQIIGFIGALLAIISFQSNRHGVIMALKTASETVFAVQLMLLGAYTGVAMNIIGSVRNLIFAALVKKGKSTTPWIIVFSVLTVVFGVLTWAGPIRQAYHNGRIRHEKSFRRTSSDNSVLPVLGSVQRAQLLACRDLHRSVLACVNNSGRGSLP